MFELPVTLNFTLWERQQQRVHMSRRHHRRAGLMFELPVKHF